MIDLSNMLVDRFTQLKFLKLRKQLRFRETYASSRSLILEECNRLETSKLRHHECNCILHSAQFDMIFYMHHASAAQEK